LHLNLIFLSGIGKNFRCAGNKPFFFAKISAMVQPANSGIKNRPSQLTGGYFVLPTYPGDLACIGFDCPVRRKSTSSLLITVLFCLVLSV
jgi:hypothetical protein